MLQFLPGERKGTNLRQSPLWWVSTYLPFISILTEPLGFPDFSEDSQYLSPFQHTCLAKTEVLTLQFAVDDPTPYQTLSNCAPPRDRFSRGTYAFRSGGNTG